MPTQPPTVSQQCVINAGVLEGFTGIVTAVNSPHRVTVKIDGVRGVLVEIAPELLTLLKQKGDCGKNHPP